jgi:hypothetical protein
VSRARSCRCAQPKAERREDGKGATIAVTCNACHRFIAQRCRVCLRDFRDLALHLAKSECGPFDKAGMWWTSERPPWAGAPPRNKSGNLSLDV